MRVGGAGVCRTDLHIIEGQWEQKSGVGLPYTIGHENAGWVHEVGSAVSNVVVGDPVILHPLVTCGLFRACRDGDDVHCANSAFPGIDTDGGYAELLRSAADPSSKPAPSLEPAAVAALADAGLTAIHAVRKAAATLRPRMARRRSCRRARAHRYPGARGRSPRPRSSSSTGPPRRSASHGSSAHTTPCSPTAARWSPSST